MNNLFAPWMAMCMAVWMTCGPAYSQEREEKEKARARLDWEEMEQRDEVGSRDTRSRLDSEGNFIDDVFFLASAMAGQEPSSDSSFMRSKMLEGLSLGTLLASPPFPDSGFGFGLGFYGSSDEGLAGYLELKAVGGGW